MLKNISRRAQEKKISIRQIEQLAGIGKNTITKWDNISPSVDKVQRVASVLECTIDDLIREEAQA